MKMRIGYKDISMMYSSLSMEDRNGLLALENDDLYSKDITDQSRTAIEIKMSQKERNRS